MRPASRIISWLRPTTLQSHLIHMVLALVLIQIGVSWYVISGLAANIFREQIGMTALQTARTVAQMPTIRVALAARDPHGLIQKLAESLRTETGAAFIVVCDKSQIRYSHPLPQRIGKKFVGGDTGPVLNEGRSYVSEAVGTLGRSLRGMAPVFGADGSVIGFVSVGYMLRNVHQSISAHLQKPLLYIIGMSLLGILSAVFIAGRLKKLTLGLEPSEITSLYLERVAVLRTIREGVIAIDTQGRVRIVNQAARRYLGLNLEERYAGRTVETILPGAGLRKALQTGLAEIDQERTVAGQELIFNIMPVSKDQAVHGVVASFRRKDELDRLAAELSRVQEYSELLRVQTHEFSNKLHTIAGLIQIEAYQEALDLVVTESTGYEDFIRFLGEAIPHPVIAAIILGKYNRAKELRVKLSIDRDGTLTDVPPHISQEKIVTVIGNLLDNAFEAVLGQPEDARRVDMAFTDLGNDIVFEIEDSGPGIPDDQMERIFEKGVSSKGQRRRGVGLYLVRQRLDELGGQIMVDRSRLGGALFTVIIPKESR
ncbi:signal transduction histidine kinase regulating citrate/malate metabolism [Desulfovibrio sp. X2]|uniref:ATP-binding protein n=1 Tax=Desulfovibrio sp. X2 TaxID=941449 RepID=UPI0003589825|nr:sensor histidine kinase [Desulfovibrio sp. X2]EPR37688.1 signal transduction histidine kinase regulating citrate/malate metabolism [Desulfovibrio sp. X2]